ncbi:hypothetical protein N9980_01875 [bacterium]|nr:hypothetical protein [bacterium]
MVQHAELTRESAAQAVTPSSATADLLGGSGAASLLVTSGVLSAQSDPAPRPGIMIIGMPNGFDCRLRIEQNPTALVTDPLYLGPNVWHFPVLEGDRVSFFGGAVTATVTVCMAKG